MTNIKNYETERKWMIDYIERLEIQVMHLKAQLEDEYTSSEELDEILEDAIMMHRADNTSGHIDENEIMRKLSDERKRRMLKD